MGCAECMHSMTLPSIASPYLRELLAGQGLLDGAALTWPANVSFGQLLSAIGVTIGTGSGFAVSVGAGDGQRLDNYKRPINPVMPLYSAGFGGLAIEEDTVYADGGAGSSTARRGMPYASALLPKVLAQANATAVQVVWAAALPSSIGELLAAAHTPTDFDALHVDVDGLELPLLRAILAAGYSPKVICTQFNSDVPPPVYYTMAWRDATAPRPSGATPELAGPSAAALFHELCSGGRYSLVAFQLGRWARWCQRCEQRAWFVRSDLLGLSRQGGGGRGAPLVSSAQAVRMFWAAQVASVLAPRIQPGKLLGHSNRVVGYLARQTEAQARAAAAHAWNGTSIRARTAAAALAMGAAEAPISMGHAGQKVARPLPERSAAAVAAAAGNASERGWCVRAEPCPLHAMTHAPSPQAAADEARLELAWQWQGRHVVGVTHKGTIEAQTTMVDNPRPLVGATTTRTLLHMRLAEASGQLATPLACALARQMRASCAAEHPRCASYEFELGVVHEHGLQQCGCRGLRCGRGLVGRAVLADDDG